MTITDVTDTWSQPIPAPRRRASAQKRIRAQAAKLDALQSSLPWPVKPCTCECCTANPGVTADQLRLVADLLDHPSWGQE